MKFRFSLSYARYSLPSLASFINGAGNGVNWTLGANPNYTHTSGPGRNRIIQAAWDTRIGQVVTIAYNLTVTITGTWNLRIGSYDGASFISYTDINITAGTMSGMVNVLMDALGDNLALRVNNTSGAGGDALNLTINSLTSNDYTSQSINEPDGWKDIKLKVERHPEYHSLIEMIDTNFFFYNSNNFVDGGRFFISDIETRFGLNSIISILVELTEDDVTYDEVFTGNLDLSTIKDISRGNKFYKYSCAVIPSNLWSQFINRKSTKVDLRSLVDLDGNTNPSFNKYQVTLPPQSLRKNSRYEQYYEADSGYFQLGFDVDATNKYATIDLPKKITEEVVNKFNYPMGTSNLTPNELFLFLEAGTYDFDIAIYLSSTHNASAGNATGTGDKMQIQFGSAAAIDFIKTNLGTNGVHGRSRFTYASTGNVFNESGTVRIWFYFANVGSASYFIMAQGAQDPVNLNYIDVTGNTTYGSTTADMMLVHDAASSIVSKMSGNQTLVYSEYMGGTTQGYGQNGCAYLTGLTQGINVRGYDFASKPFSMSFDDWWNGMNPIFCLGLGPETIYGIEKLRIEQRSHFYDDNTILTFDYVNDIERSYDVSVIFKSVDIGYQTWSAESDVGVDDVQTKHTYSSVYRIIGNTISIMSTFLAAALAIEQTRRNRAQSTKDWRLDNNIFVIDLDTTTTVQVGSPFTSITGMYNPTTRYNIRFSVYRNLKRWMRFLSGCLESGRTTTLTYNSGEGNVLMAVGANSDTCDTGTWTENQNVVHNTSPEDNYLTPQMYRITVPLTWTDWKLWRVNKARGLAVSITNTDHKICHIKAGEYDIHNARAVFNIWIK